MYNEKVTWRAANSVWTYEPVKYWPNAFGSSAQSDAIDRLSFFAYAPYVAVTPSNGSVVDDATKGITGLSRNSINGDPFVKFVVSMDPGTVVDLCWGVAEDDFKSSVDGNRNNVKKGCPYIDVVKPKLGDKIAFDFHHALSALNVQIDAAVDATTAGTAVDGSTRIFVRSVSFEGLATKGALNLNSTVAAGPSWTDYTGTGAPLTETLTVYDGRKDGKEGMEGAVASSETPTGLNPVLVQSCPYSDSHLSEGVTKTPVNLFNSTDKATPVFVIPTSEPLKVTIVYDVETRDEKLNVTLSDGVTHGSKVTNVISNTVQIGGSDFCLEAGKRYTIAMHIGLTSVKFDATVANWDGTVTGTTVNLPQNSN